MSDPEYRDEQLRHCFSDHVAPINRFVDELRRKSWAPYIAPMYGGTSARLLYVMQDPGKKTQDDGGSGFLSWENNDPTAENLCKLATETGIEASDVVPWNAYPWYINRNPKAGELEEGIETLKCLIDLLPDLEVVMLLGRSARDGWKRFARKHPATAQKLRVIETYHTSPLAFRHKDPAVRDQRRADQFEAFCGAARILAEKLHFERSPT